MFFNLFLSMVSVFLMIAIGFLARRRRWIDAETTSNLSRLTMTLFYPALIFSALTQRFDRMGLARSWPLPAGAFMIAAIGFGAGWLLSRKVRFADSRERGVFRFQCTMNNYSFLPLPLLLMLRGEDAVAALLFSALGSEIACWTLGIMSLTGAGFNAASLRRLLNVPMLTVAFSLGIVWFREISWVAHLGVSGAGWVGEVFLSVVRAADLFGRATIPLAMMVAGCRMADLRVAHLATARQMLLLAARLLAIPLLTVGVLFLLPLEHAMREVLIVVAVMPCAVTSVVLSEAYGSDSNFAASSVLTTQLASLLTVPLWLSLTIS